MADEVLVKYKSDIGGFDKTLDQLEEKFRTTEAAGKKAFSGFDDGAKKAGKSVDDAGNKAQSAAPKFNALGNSINQLSREMPAFAVNVNTGFLAISNNIPALVDSINQIKAANAALAAEGKQTTSVLSQVAKSIFSWQTGISIGITLLTVFGGKIIEFIAGQKDGAEATKEAEEALKKENAQLKINAILTGSYTASLKNEIALVDKSNAANAKAANTQDLIIKQKQEILDLDNKQRDATIELLKQFGIEYTDYIKLQEAESDPKIRAALGQSRLDDLKSRVQITTSLREQMTQLDDAFAQQRITQEQRQQKEFQEVIKAGNNAIVNEDIAAMKRRLKVLEAGGDEMLLEFNSLQIAIFDKELKTIDAGTEAYKDKFAEREAFIVSSNLKLSEEQRKIADQMYKHQQEYLKRQEKLDGIEYDLREQALKRQEKLELHHQKEFDKQQSASVKNEDKRLKESLKNKDLSYKQQQELLAEQLEKGFITQEAYKNATIELEDEKDRAIVAGIQAVANGIMGFAQLAGQNTEAGKALAVASATIDSIASAVQIFKAVSSATYLGPAALPLAVISSAGALAGGMARVAQIQAVNVPQPNLQAPNFTSTATTYNAPRTGRSGRAYKDGVVDLDGPGTWTSDDIPYWLSKGETVIPSLQTSQKKDDLTALWKSVPEYERFLQVKYVNPAVKKAKEQSFAESIAYSAQINFSDKRIVKAIEKNKPATAHEIAYEIAKSNRTAKFEDKLKGK